MPQDHEKFMQISLENARKAYDYDEVPVGAVVVLENEVIGSAYNKPISTSCPTAHAELLAINLAAKKIGNYRLINADVYTTLEPCIMCYGAMVHARVKRCIYAASDPKLGVFTKNITQLVESKVNHKVEFIKGPCEDESAQLLQQFFKDKRNKK